MTADPLARLAAVVRPGWVPERSDAADPGPAAPPDDDGPAHRLQARTMPRQVGVAALLAAAAVVAALVGRGVLSDAGAVDTLPATPGRSAAVRTSPVPLSSSGPATVSASGPARVVVHVVGRVHRPGLVTLAPGARVAEAVAAAGGATAGAALQRINLARVLVDGEQLPVPGPDDPLPGSVAGPGSGSGSGPDQPVDLNTATEADLDRLPGVGPVTAARIIAWRRQHQRFTRVEELGEIDGIGAKMLERLRPLVRV
jgi:competence protein ComEA